MNNYTIVHKSPERILMDKKELLKKKYRERMDVRGSTNIQPEITKEHEDIVCCGPRDYLNNPAIFALADRLSDNELENLKEWSYGSTVYREIGKYNKDGKFHLGRYSVYIRFQE